ncbi:amino acid ABC transporter, permease/ATP-binding protein, His/Glu/Gln/Arg/opine family [Klebsiella variicola]|uniref:Amino acid ABC transporter, permease/ATP-binding protein, His/Glu/Gln/Arg/opine family n=1 Tax=Klebsiella variicola TaxID=244366 RepID=A0A7H4MJ31_KLEVA|nr:amino acid ABC transporter, permease/ATP-binding protein, His/Glu/Gln/Arg/opine family [Klebsiella variicola]
MKLSSLVSVISLTEILMVGQQLYSQNFLVMETMTAVAFITSLSSRCSIFC